MAGAEAELAPKPRLFEQPSLAEFPDDEVPDGVDAAAWRGLHERYEVLGPMGHGVYGVACSALDRATDQRVAVQKVESLFDHDASARRTLRELRMLRHLQHENLLRVRSIFLPSSAPDFEDIYIIADLMETDLASILRSPQPLCDDHLRFFLYQLLRGLRYVHSAEVAHCDLKPQSLLVNSDCDLKICDFGLARMLSLVGPIAAAQPDTECVFTRRWYRAPEVLCSWNVVSLAIDVWSVGCILAEMLLREPIFPATSTRHQLGLVVRLLGPPNEAGLKRMPNENARRYLASLPTTPARPFLEEFPEAPELARGFLECALLWDPRARPTVAEAIGHEYLAALHWPDDEPTRGPLDPEEFNFERREGWADSREEVFREASHYHPDLHENTPRAETPLAETPSGMLHYHHRRPSLQSADPGTFSKVAATGPAGTDPTLTVVVSDSGRPGMSGALSVVDSAILVFRRFDGSGSGTLPREMFVQAIRKINPAFTADDVTAMLEAAGSAKAGDVAVHYEEFVRWAFVRDP